MIKRIINKIKRILRREKVYRSETAKCRDRLGEYCQGNGVDLGAGGDLITADSISVDLPKPYRNVGKVKPNLKGDARNLIWFKNGVLDYVYASHLLEDFKDTEKVLKEWLRVLKPEGAFGFILPG